MLSTDVLLSVPTESTVVRAVVASLTAALLVRVLLGRGLRIPRIRTVAVLAPVLALVAITAMSWGDAGLPTLMTSVKGAGDLPLPVSAERAQRIFHLAPLAWPLLLTAWLVAAGALAGLRLLRLWRTRRAAVSCARTAAAEGGIRSTVRAVAERMRVPPPPVALCSGWPGGATVVGILRPVLLVDEDLARTLDPEELEGLVAHELAHVRRRDNLVALLAALAQDLAFFVPGVRGVVRGLHREREAAADQLAVQVTGRPGALASGLLKVLDARHGPAGCSAFVTGGSVVDRVRLLVEDLPAQGPVRAWGEGGLVAVSLALAVLAGVALPARVGDHPGVGDALALVWAAASPADGAVPSQGEAVAWAVYRRNGLAPQARAEAEAAILSDDGRELSQAVLRSDERAPRQAGLGLTPGPRVRHPTDLVREWRATRVVGTEGRLAVYWLHRLGERVR